MTTDNSNKRLGEPSAMAGIVERNIEALLAKREQEAQNQGFQEKAADAIGGFAGSMPFVYLHLLIFGLWVVVNLGWTPLPPFDETFVVLAMIASVESIFLSTFVLITQNRMQGEADRRADLDLQVSLLAEHEITKLVALVSRMAERMEIEEAGDPALAELKRNVVPEDVLDKIEETQEKFKSGTNGE